MTCESYFSFRPSGSNPPSLRHLLTLTAPDRRLDYQDTTNVDEKGIAFTIRSVFILDPKKVIRTILSYPASTGRNSAEVLRIVDSLQTGDKNKVTTPVNWVPGDDVIVHPSIKGEEATKLFPNLRAVKPYLRFTPLPKA
jgi:glutaredoxin/glutathione-dependent peroxiredoxin